MRSVSAPAGPSNLAANAKLWLGGLLMVCSLAAVVAALPRGLDLTDEGSYLQIIAFPERYFRVSQFGFVLNPIFTLAGRDIVVFRFFGLIAVLLPSLYLFWRILTLLRRDVCPFGTTALTVLVLLFGSTAILFYGTWLPTPNYNTLNLCGALLVAAGLVPRPNHPSDPAPVGPAIVDGSLLAMGMAICFLAKPTTPVLLAPLVLLVIARAKRKLLLAAIAWGGAGAIAIATLLAIDGTPDAVIHRYADERGWRHVLQSGHDFASLLAFPSHRLTTERALGLLFAFAAGLIAAGTAGSGAWRSAAARRGVVVLFVVLAAAAVGIHFFVSESNLIVPLAIPIFAVACGGVLLATGRETGAAIHRTMLTAAAVFMAIPFALGFGSSSALVVSARLYSVFWVAGALLTIGALSRDARARDGVVAAALVASIVCASVVVGSWIRPFRLPSPLWSQTEWIAVRDRDRAVRVDSATAAYFQQLRAAARRNGFADGTPIIDLTGMSPMTVYALGGTAVGVSWLLGGHPGSAEFAALIVARMPRADRERAWILTAPGGHRSIDSSVLTRNGLAFPAGYAEAGRATTGFMTEGQVLWKPVP